jgi:hypothetical protein
MGWHGTQAWCRGLICASPASFLKILWSGARPCSAITQGNWRLRVLSGLYTREISMEFVACIQCLKPTCGATS